jgi:hypothetical protein
MGEALVIQRRSAIANFWAFFTQLSLFVDAVRHHNGLDSGEKGWGLGEHPLGLEQDGSGVLPAPAAQVELTLPCELTAPELCSRAA